MNTKKPRCFWITYCGDQDIEEGTKSDCMFHLLKPNVFEGYAIHHVIELLPDPKDFEIEYSCRGNVLFYPEKGNLGCYETKMFYEINDDLIIAFEAGFKAAMRYFKTGEL